MPREPDPPPADPIPALKQQVAGEIRQLVGNWNLYVAARRLGIDESEMWHILRDRLDRFSLQKLIRLLARLDRHVELRVVAASNEPLRQHRFPPRTLR